MASIAGEFPCVLNSIVAPSSPPSAAGLLLPVRPALAGLWADKGFTHGVASGDPGPGSIKLWTRYAAAGGGEAVLKVAVASDPGMRRVIAKGEALASPATWGTAQTRITGLPQKGWVYYRFTAPDGSQSPIGRTRTLPAGDLARVQHRGVQLLQQAVRLVQRLCPCRGAQRSRFRRPCRRLLYEYARGTYPSDAQTLAGREIEPADEMVALDDYRQRYASYRVDPGLQELHRLYPMIAIWDDHEFANDTWRDGAREPPGQ